jgi:hypothetical protein
VVSAFLFGLPSSAVAQSRPWEIVPKADARLKAGKLSVVGGATAEQGVRFIVKNLEITRPIEIGLVSLDSSRRLELLVYKDSPQQPLLERATDARGVAVARFRTADSVQLLVRGPAGATYQLMTWVGPRVVAQAPPAFVPVDAAGAPLVAAATPPEGSLPGRNSEPAPTAAASVASSGPVSTAIAVLLALILAALVVIIALLRRGRGKSAAAFLLSVLIARQSAAQGATGNLEPWNVPPGDSDTWINDFIEGLRERLSKAEELGLKAELEELKIIPETDDEKDDEKEPEKPSLRGRIDKLKEKISKRAGQAVTTTKYVLSFMEEFGLIDPREAAVQPNYSPPGQPLIPSRCAGTGECGQCFAEATARLDKARTLLEDQYVIYKQTELKAGRIHELAGAAADLSGFAKLAWTAAKNNPREPMNVAQQRFYDIYDRNLEKLLGMLNEGLIGVGACEREHFKDFDWYPRYGMVYYNFMRDRYTRK